MLPEWLIIPSIWLLVILAITMIAAVLCIKLFWHMIQLNIQLKKHVEEVKKKTAEKYNKIASLPPVELDSYLGVIYGIVLEIAAVTDISDRDPEAAMNLYTSSLSRMLEYLGMHNIEAIEYYYGPKWVDRWCELRFKYLSNTGVINNIMAKLTTASGITTQLNVTGKDMK